ncbi:hypothetical protein H5410_009888 [Solanum commersonii]|uniref:Uncharacterized protein n=1 Tax=Solanum commersonii TaxID=4109 RepID=A0A9J6AJ72_SOLCO|nr:hypothetical protein H5410_009888 [Solanum commersonii]
MTNNAKAVNCYVAFLVFLFFIGRVVFRGDATEILTARVPGFQLYKGLLLCSHWLTAHNLFAQQVCNSNSCSSSTNAAAHRNSSLVPNAEETVMVWSFPMLRGLFIFAAEPSRLDTGAGAGAGCVLDSVNPIRIL